MPQNKSKRDSFLDGENQLPGLPGYRTRPGRSGYDPLDTNREAGFMEGTFFRNLFTLRLRTRNPFYLILMFVFGAPISVFMPLALYVISTAPNHGTMTLIDYPALAIFYLMWGFILVIGLALLANFSINMAAILGIGKNRLKSKDKNEAAPKKTPKRRKDYR